MAEGTISIGNTTLDTPSGYTHFPDKLETYKRSLNGTLHITRAVTDEDQPLSKFTFEVKDVVNSKMLAIKEEASHISNLYYIDYLKITEVLSGNGIATQFYTQRIAANSATAVPVISIDGVAKTVTWGTLEDLPATEGEVIVLPEVIHINSTGNETHRTAKLYCGDTPTDTDDNIVIQYIPKYSVHITDFKPTHKLKDITYYTLICEEV